MIIRIISFFFIFPVFISSLPVHSAVFNISSGDVTGLIAAIRAANSNGEENTINLAPGIYTLTSVDNGTFGRANGLPVIFGRMIIKGESAEMTVIEREKEAPEFRIVQVAGIGKLTLNRIAVRGGKVDLDGAGLINSGTLTIHSSIIERNSAFRGGGIRNTGKLFVSQTRVWNNGAHDGAGINNTGEATIIDSSIMQNVGDNSAGFFNEASGTATIRNSTISHNQTIFFAGIRNDQGLMTITNSTIANNRATGPGGGAALSNRSPATVNIINSTISANRSGSSATIVAGEGITMQNTIVALNHDSPDCPPTSLGNNLFGNPIGCSSALHPTDLTGEPGLGAFIDSGVPGGGRFPLLSNSPAIDAGNASACPATDQLETPRRGRCDIGAVEFYSIINDLVAAGNVITEFHATPVPEGPAGTFRISAEFNNTNKETIGYRFAEVVELSGGNLLLNADRGAGGVGARLTVPDSRNTPLLPGATERFEFVIGLQNQEPFTFFVNLLGDPEISNTSMYSLKKQ